ncbi:MAG: hypothetical protein EAZ92_14765 [Candidatus Kapaibacterium sp.]|nr:MAG: hypothetical protein EAZ92_14765 [Candidatus Kapabacteria bacterium]
MNNHLTPILRVMLLAFMLILSRWQTFAQTPESLVAPLVVNGMGGIMVFTGNKMVSPDKPIGGVTGFNIYRRIKGGQDTLWKKLNTALVTRSADKAEYTKYMGEKFWSNAAKYFQKNEEEVYQMTQTAVERSDIGTLFIDPRVPLPLGLAFVDSTAQKGPLYEYAVAPVLVDKSEAKRVVVGAERLQDPPLMYDLRSLPIFTTIDSVQAELKMRYIMSRKGGLYGFEILRGDGLQRPMKSLVLQLVGMGSPDPAMIYRDSTLQYGGSYRYAIVPFDGYFNKSLREVDTLKVVFAHVPIIPISYNLRVSSTSAGLQLNWSLAVPPNPGFRFTRIYRSKEKNNPDAFYERYDDVAYNDTTYIDKKVKPGESWYYRLQTVTMDMKQGSQSAFNGAMYILGQTIPPPSNLTAVRKEGEKFTRLRWSHPDNAEPMEGYFIFRSLSRNGKMAQISELIKDTTYVDSTKNQDPYSPYYYAVASLHKTFRRGQLSQPIAVLAPPKTPLPAPPTPKATQDIGAVVVQWNNLLAAQPYLAGYCVYRTINGKTEKLTKAPLSPQTLEFRDGTVPQDAEKVSYSLSITDMLGRESAPSKPNDVPVVGDKLSPPSSVRLGVANGGKSVIVRWASSNDKRIQSYEVFRSRQGELPVKIATVPVDKPLETLDKQIKSTQPHYYKVVAVGKTTRSNASLEASIVP